MARSLLAFLDTNTFLHYPSVGQIDWLGLLGATDVTLLVPPVVPRELDRLKFAGPTKRVRHRASAALANLHGYADGDLPAKVRGGVMLDFVASDPRVDFDSLLLSRFVKDDQLLASVIEYSGERAGGDIILVTSDLGLKVKARQRKIPTASLPDSLLLPIEPDPSERRVRELEDQLRALNSSLPELQLVFEDSGDRCSFCLEPPSPSDGIDEQIAELKRRYPLLTENQQLQGSAKGGPFEALGRPEPRDVLTYNQRLWKFYDEYAKYLGELEKFEEQKKRIICLRLWLMNSGGAPAQDIDIAMHFPDGFLLVAGTDLPKPPTEPKQPPFPRTPMEKLAPSLVPGLDQLASARFLNPAASLRDAMAPTIRNVSKPTIKRSKSYDVDLHVRSVKHKFRVPLDPMYAVFESVEAARSFHADYHIYAGNYPDRIQGRVHIIIEKSCGVAGAETDK